MKNKNVIKKILFEGEHQISAMLPRDLSPERERDTFVYKIPVILNKTYFLKNENQRPLDYFKIIFYNQSDFSNDFESKFYSKTLDYKKHDISSEINNSYFFDESIKNISKGFYQDGNIKNQHYTINFKNNNIVDEDLYVYNITLTNEISKSIIYKKYTCMRIFAIKDNSIVDDTDFIIFENEMFLENVFNLKKIYDLQYFIDQVYFEDFAKSLNITIPANPFYHPDRYARNSIRILKSQQFDVSMATGSININVDFLSSEPIESVSESMNISTFIDNSLVEVTNLNFFKNIVKLYLTGLDIFVFKVQCVFSINSELDSDSQSNIAIQRIFENQVFFNRNDGFITSILQMYKNEYLTSLYNNFGFNISTSATSNHIEVILKADNITLENQLLSFFKIKSIKNNNTEYFDSELYSSPNFTINDKINFMDLNMQDLMSNQNQAFKFYIPNNSVNIFSKIKITIQHDEYFDLGVLESDVIIINPDYENLFNKLNNRLLSSIEIYSNGLNKNASSEDCFTTYSKIKIKNLRRRFGDIAYNFGYFNQQDSQNTQSTSDILEFFKSSVFSFELEEKIQNIGNCSFKKHNYFFGNQIIKNDSIENDSIEIDRSFLLDYLKINISSIFKNSIINSTSSYNTVKAISSIGKDFAYISNNQNPVDVFSFLVDDKFFLIKKIRIKVIPIPKLIKIYQSQADLDENLNLVFPSNVSDDIKNSINLNFVDLFYDKNSSLNWNRFLNFKTLFFKKNSSDRLNSLISTAVYLSPIWDYLSSKIYIKDSNVFTNVQSFTNKDLQETAQEDSLSNINKNSGIIRILAKNHFQDSNNKYFNFQINNDNLIKIVNTGMLINFKNMDNELKNPKYIEILKTNENREDRIDIDLTGLKNYFDIREITGMKFFAKLSIHPLLMNESNTAATDVVSADFINTNLESNNDFYLTQNNSYMSRGLKSYFFEYNNPVNNFNSTIEEADNSLILSLRLGKNRKKITSTTFRELLDFSINNNMQILKDFYLRLGFSFEINNNYFYANIYKVINRNNFNDSLIEINRVESIIEI